MSDQAQTDVSGLPAPRIARLGWGSIELDDGRRFKDAKLWPGGGREWDWRETGTRHEPGIQPDDVEELVRRGARCVVLSSGHHERLQVMPETLEWLRSNDVETVVLPTAGAVDRYNELRERTPVGGLFHSTC